MHSIPLNSQTGQAGIGLRTQHLQDLLAPITAIPWVELLLDNWLTDGGATAYYLDAIAERYPLSLHGVGLSLGGMEPLDMDYLGKVKRLYQQTHALCYSEHLCFSRLQTHYSHDLLPLPYTDEALNHLAQRIRQVQDFLGAPIVIENVSSYISYGQSTLTEGEFIAHLAHEADCGLLLDVNNFYVNQVNHNQDALTQMRLLPTERIVEIHLAGFEDKGSHVIDAHNHPVAQPVWNLYEEMLSHLGAVPTLIEWDKEIPPFEQLVAEHTKAQGYLDRAKVEVAA